MSHRDELLEKEGLWLCYSVPITKHCKHLHTIYNSVTYTNRSQHVLFSDSKFDNRDITHGVPQGNTHSTKFLVTNGVKQEGIMSPCLFNVYMNNLRLSLNSSGIGGLLGDNIVNHLCYADDLCLISLSSSGMQHLLDICDTYAISHQLSYNATKSFSLCFRPKQFKMNPPCFVLGKQLIPAVDKCTYLGIIVSEANCDGDLIR